MLTALDLFNQQNYNDAIVHLNNLIISNNDNIDAYNLRGKCWYYAAHHADSAEQQERFMQSAADDFTVVINAQPHQKEALMYRAYIHANEIDDKQQILLQDAQQLIFLNDEECLLKGYDYAAVANFEMNEPDEALKYLQLFQKQNEKFYANNKPELAQKLNECFSRIGDVYADLKSDVATAIKYYEEAYEQYPYNHYFNYAAGIFALDNGYHNFAGIALDQFAAMYQVHSYGHLLDDVHSKLKAAYPTSNFNENIANALLLYNRMFEADILEQISFAKDCIKLNANNGKAYHYLGSVLFDEQKYKDCIPHFEKAIANNGFAISYARYLICIFENGSKIQDATKQIEKYDDVIDLYTAGTIINSHSFNNNVEIKNNYLLVFYKKAYDLFTYYYYYNKGNAMSNNEHYYAMLCNNYGIALANANKFADAIPIHKTGFKHSPFWEQLNSLSHAQTRVNDWSGVVETCNTAMERFAQNLPLQYYVLFYVRIIKAYNQLRQFDKAKEMIASINSEKTDIISACGNDAYVYKEVQEYYSAILAESLVKDDNANSASKLAEIKIMEAAVNENPEDKQSVFMLLQYYTLEGMYEKALGSCAYYLNLCDGDISNLNLQITHHMQGQSLFKLNRYDEALVQLHKAEKLDPSYYWNKHYQCISYFKLKNSKEGRAHGWKCIMQYSKEFTYDKDIDEVVNLMVDDMISKNDKKEIKTLITNIADISESQKKVKELKKQHGGSFFGLFS